MELINNEYDECCICLDRLDKNKVVFNCDTCVSKLCSTCYDKITIIDWNEDERTAIYTTKCPCCRTNNDKSVNDFSKDQLKVLLLDSISHQSVFAEVVMMIKINIHKKTTKFCNNLKKIIKPASVLIGSGYDDEY
jgi:hypothetical protein